MVPMLNVCATIKCEFTRVFTKEFLKSDRKNNDKWDVGNLWSVDLI